jgi:hypothetical protein
MTEPQFGEMSPVVRHELPVARPHVQTASWPHSHIAKKIGRPVAARASRIVSYRCWLVRPPWSPQLSYLSRSMPHEAKRLASRVS